MIPGDALVWQRGVLVLRPAVNPSEASARSRAADKASIVCLRVPSRLLAFGEVLGQGVASEGPARARELAHFRLEPPCSASNLSTKLGNGLGNEAGYRLSVRTGWPRPLHALQRDSPPRVRGQLLRELPADGVQARVLCQRRDVEVERRTAPRDDLDGAQVNLGGLSDHRCLPGPHR